MRHVRNKDDSCTLIEMKKERHSTYLHIVVLTTSIVKPVIVSRTNDEKRKEKGDRPPTH